MDLKKVRQTVDNKDTVDLKYHKWKYMVFRANGNMEEFPSKYITF